MKKPTIKKFLKKAVPLWLVVILVLDISLATNFVQYYFAKQQQTKLLSQLKNTTNSQSELISLLKQEVIPQKGYKTSILWKDLGKQLVDAGAIDKQKFEQSFISDADGKDHMKYLDGSWNEPMQINEKNSRFMVDFLWALGLVNKSKILDEGPMQEDTANFASTGGWTLGSKEPMELYSSKELIKLTQEQQDLVKKIADNVFRPCCSNAVSFPDCNHGMAALGYIELGVKSGLSEQQIYKDLLALNSYWFPQTYVEMAAYFNKDIFSGQNPSLGKSTSNNFLASFNILPGANKQSMPAVKWTSLDAKKLLSKEYSSARGAREITQSIQDLPGFQIKSGGSCGA